jgi:tetratricopeptide (TPR) repeat protein
MSATVWHCKCGAKYELREEWLGRRVRCKHCGVITRVEKPSKIKAPPSIPKTSVPSRETSSLPLNKFEDDREFDRERDLPDTLMQIESWDVDAAIRAQGIDIALAAEDAGIKTFDKLVANSVEGAIEGIVNPPGGNDRTQIEQVRVDGDQHRVGNAALSEYIPNFDDFDENLVEAFRCIVEAVNRLREGRPFRNTGTSLPFSLNLDWADWDDDVAALLAQVERAIERLRAAMEDGEPLPSADFVFRFDESIIDDDLIVFVRRIQVVLNGLREGQSPGAIDSQLMLFDLSETHTQDRKALTPPSKSAEVPSRKDESSWQSLVIAARDSGQHGKAVELAEQAVREYPRSDWLWRELGGELIEVDRLDEAEQALETALRLDPNAAWLWRRFAALHRKRKDLEQEIESLETLNSLGVATWHDIVLLGIAHHNHRDLAKALKYYRLSAAAKPDAVPWVNLALVYSDPELSQDADAADAYRRALALKPDYELAKELLDTTKRKLLPLAARAQSAASGLVESDEFFDFYISPFEMLQITDMTVANGLDAKAIKKAKDRLNAELKLNDGKVSWLGDYSLDKARALAVVDELDDEAKRRYHLAVYRNNRLLNFLTRGDIQHFLYRDDYFPCDTEELLHREPGFRTFLSKPFAKQYNRVLTRAIEQRRLPVVEVLFDGRRWVEPEDEDLCFDGASKRVGDIVEKMRAIVRGGTSRKVSLREIEVFLREHSLPELFNLLPVHFASYQGEIVRELRFLAISCFKKYDEFILSRDFLNLCKRFTSRDVAFNEQLQEDFKTIEAMISAERASKATQPDTAFVRKPETNVQSETLTNPSDAVESFLWLWGRVTNIVSVLFFVGLLVLIAITLFNSCSTRTSSSSLPHTPSVSSTDTVRAPTVSPPKLLPAVPLPANGMVRRYGFSEGIAPLTIATRKGGGHYFVRLRTVGTRELIAEVFVREGQQASIEVPLGTYELTYATGRTWYGPRAGALFGPETGYAKADDTFTFRREGNQILGYTVELYQQAFGNLETEPMSAREF